jgi:hypothetical protein
MVPAGTESLYAGIDARSDGTNGVFDQVGEAMMAARGMAI